MLLSSTRIQEQQEITRILEILDCKSKTEENRQRALDALFKTLLHHLMTGKVRVHDLQLPSL